MDTNQKLPYKVGKYPNDASVPYLVEMNSVKLNP